MKNESETAKRETDKSAKRRNPRGRKPGSKFEWGEVDNVTQEDMLMPAKKRKGNRRRNDRAETTLTVSGQEEVDLYAIKPPASSDAAERDDPAIPSYGKMMENEEDEFSVFLRNAEKADARDREKELVKKTREARKSDAKGNAKKEAKPEPPASSGGQEIAQKGKKRRGKKSSAGQNGEPAAVHAPQTKRPEKNAAPSDNPLADFRGMVENVRAYGIARMDRIGFSAKEKDEFISSLSTVDRMLGLIDILLHSSVHTGAEKSESAEPEAPEPKASAIPEPAKPQKREKTAAKKVRPAREEAGESKPAPESETRESANALAKIRANWTFGGVPLSDAMLAMLSEVHYEAPTPIQAGTIPQILAGKDIMGQSQTGSGKTAAFMIPIIERVEGCEPGDDPVALIVVPTRELAVQIRDETAKLAHNREIAAVACYGGKPIADQIKKMRGGVDIVIGTPGRILDLAKRSALSLGSLKWVVLDEADRMLDIGFRPDIERILRQTPRDRQTLLFSATLADPVVRLAQRYMTEPETCDFSEKDIASDTIEQFYITVDRDRKFEALVHLLRRENPQQAIVFCRTKRGVDKLGRGLTNEFGDWAISAIHGDLTQSSRDSIMRSFRAGKIKILVATDVVGRGIDVSGISHIINYDIPEFCDDYVHRVGRTGRMGREGVAYTLVTSEEGAELTRIEMRINRLLQRTELEDFEAFTRPDDSEKAEPKEQKPVFGKPQHRVRRAL